ncbi:MAG TPA: hypothetical protein VJX29_06540, partial [Candidatus Acidoferrales bacterium]|nr:hypothetical protein [Candidatus Acidoferrales bacterium]
MFEPPRDAKKTRWANFSRYSWLVLAAAVICAAGTFLLRGRENRAIDEEMERRAATKKAEEDRRTVEMMGGNRFEILAFYAAPAT